MTVRSFWDVLREAHEEVNRMSPRERGEHPCPGCGSTLRTSFTRCQKCHCQECDGRGHVIDSNLEMYQCSPCAGRGYIRPIQGT